MKSRVINIREQDAELYPTFKAWWEGHGWPAVAQAILPKCGVLVEEEGGEGLAVGWLYMDNSTGVAMLEWTVTNPAAAGRRSYVALCMLVDSVREVARELDYGVLLTTAKHDGLLKIYQKCGFAVTDTGMTHLLMLTKEGT